MTLFFPVPAERDDGLGLPFRWLVRSGAMAIVLFLSLASLYGIPSASKGLVETGAPSFVVLGPEALGLSTAPNDLRLLPDGRILVTSQRDVAFGDGVRWETFRETDDQQAVLNEVAVDQTGEIYSAANDGAAKIELLSGGRWRYKTVVQFPVDANTPLKSIATFPDHWYWYGGSKVFVSWRPGGSITLGTHAGTIDAIFALGKEVYVDDQSAGGLFQLKPDGETQQVIAGPLHVSDSVTCTTSYSPTELLVGTISAGIRLFDGKSFHSFGPPGLAGRGYRVTDLCAAGDGFFAAAVDTIGIIFFDRSGQTVQVLDRTLDHRLARVRRLLYTHDGVLWALLNEGVARVAFPSPVSNYNPLIPSGLAFAQPIRHAGQLWILADGRAMRGIYNAGGVLERFETDTPTSNYLFTMNDVDGHLFGCDDRGVYVYEDGEWRMAVSGLVNARVGIVSSNSDGGIYYAARGECGIIHKTGQTYSAIRIPIPNLRDSFHALADSSGIGWLELGMSRVGRFDIHDGLPTVQIFGTADGLPAGWVEEYIFEGVVRFHVGDHLYRFDEVQKKFVEDVELCARYPQFAQASGRPMVDALNRIWYTANGTNQAIDHSPQGGDRPIAAPPVGFTPTDYTVEDNGIIWMFERGRFARMDLRMPSPPAVPLRALITSVEFSASNRQLFSPGTSLPPLAYADNSLMFHFAVPTNPFTSPATFEVLLEGAGSQWVSTGVVGSAVFNRIKEGHYIFRVRPVTAGNSRGAEAHLEFTVRPPWFRTPFAWAAYLIVTIGLFAFVTWLTSYLQRRENERLELLVTRRTHELNTTNEQLGRQIQETTEKSAALSTSEEAYRQLNRDLEERVRERTSELSLSNEELRQRELLFRLIFEHAPVGISWRRTDLGVIYHINPTFRRILGLSGDVLTDYNHLTRIVHPDDAAHQMEMNRQIETGEIDSYNLEERFVLADGQLVWSSLSVAVVRDQKGRIVQEIGILQEITARKKAEHDLAMTHKHLLDVSRQAGMAEVATGVLHNVGNVLNSVNVSALVVVDQLRTSRAKNLGKVAALLKEHAQDLGNFLTRDPKGQGIPAYLTLLSDELNTERNNVTNELQSLHKNVEHIKDIVAMQQSYGKISGVTETVLISELVEDALRINASVLARDNLEIVRDYQARPQVTTERHKVLQILVNLIRNATYACDESGRPDKKLRIQLTEDADEAQIAVIDNGIGIPPENLTRIFAHGFTTRKEGHGFGLHSGALAAKELGGALVANSAGPGQGATFTLRLPTNATVCLLS